MSSVVDTGDAFTLTFTSLPGATVVVDWLNPNGVPVLDQAPVGEYPASSGKFPKTFTPDVPGMWTARFYTAGAYEDYFVRALSHVGEPPPLAAIGDVVAFYGTLTEDEATLTKMLLRVASKMVRQNVPNLDDLIAARRLDPDVVAMAPVSMALRVLRNPEGLRAETTGPFSRTYDTSAAAGLLVLTADDLKHVTPGPVAPAAGETWAPAGTVWVTPGMAPSPRWRGFHGGY